MTVDQLVMNGPAAVAFGLLLGAMVVAVAGDAVQRVIDCRRRWALRERELVILERSHRDPWAWTDIVTPARGAKP